MLIPIDGVADHIHRLARLGWLRDALILAGMALDNRQISPMEHRDLVALIRYADPTIFSRPQEVFGLVHDSVISSLQLTRLETRGDMREAFRQAVRWIEIETSSQCNRHCPYCPNSIFDRASGNDFLDQKIYNRVLSDLAEIDFDGEIVFVGNNEILMHDRNFDYLAEARRRLSGATLVVFSNGDYLDTTKLERLVKSGVDRMAITLHLEPGKPFDEAEVDRRAGLLAQRTGLRLTRTVYEPGQLILYAAELDGLQITAALHNFAVSGHDWASFLPGNESHCRTVPCSLPLRQFVISHDGDILSCCTVFRERTEHAAKTGTVTGNLRDFPSIFHAYADDAMLRWRRSAFTNGAKDGPCRTCIGHPGHDEANFAPLADYVATALMARPA